MLKFNLPNGDEFHIERDGLEERVLESIFARFEQAREQDPGMYSGLKTAVQLMLSVAGKKLDLEIPKGENVLEYVVAVYLSRALDALEANPIPVSGEMVSKDGATS